MIAISFITDGEDYRMGSTIIGIPAKVTSKSFNARIINDNIAECDEAFKLTLSIPTPPCEVVSGINETEVGIRDNDSERNVNDCVVLLVCWPTGAVLSFNQSQYSIEENITPLSVGLMLSRRTSKDVIVEVTITDGSAKGRWCNNWWCNVDIILLYSWYRLW